MSYEVLSQLIGFTNPCITYDAQGIKKHYEILREADEFAAAASLYANETDELLANSRHRYQLIIDDAVERLGVETHHLNKKRVWFNFYTDIAARFGLGTQAYTTETDRPHVGISELSLQDLYLLQLIVIHELQHAADFAYYNGLAMPIAEREVRARLSICNALRLDEHKPAQLFRNAVLDQAYWFVIFFHSPYVSPEMKLAYFELLEPAARQKMAGNSGGIIFPPLVVRIFGRELSRDGISLQAGTAYKIDKVGAQLKMSMTDVRTGQKTEQVPLIETDLEALIVDDESAGDRSQQDILAGNLELMENVPAAAKNKVADWHVYQDQYKLLKKQATIVITRDMENLANVATAAKRPSSERDAIPEPVLRTAAVLNELTHLNNLIIPEALAEIQAAEAEAVDEVNAWQYGRRKGGYGQQQESVHAEDVMQNLSELTKRRRPS